MTRRTFSLRSCLAALTDALARAEREDLVLLDAVRGAVRLDSSLEDAEVRAARDDGRALPVARPDGLWEWQMRRDFVRSIRKSARVGARRLAATLAGTRTKRRFEIALSSLHDQALVRAFALYRRRRLRGWAARLLRAALAGYVAPSVMHEESTVTRRRKPRRRRLKRRSKYVSYLA